MRAENYWQSKATHEAFRQAIPGFGDLSNDGAFLISDEKGESRFVVALYQTDNILAAAERASEAIIIGGKPDSNITHLARGASSIAMAGIMSVMNALLKHYVKIDLFEKGDYSMRMIDLQTGRIDAFKGNNIQGKLEHQLSVGGSYKDDFGRLQQPPALDISEIKEGFKLGKFRVERSSQAELKLHEKNLGFNAL